MPRNSPALLSRATPLYAQMPRDGNGHALGPNPEPPETDRFARIESLLECIQHELEVQFRRIAALQAQFDRSIADRPISPNPNRPTE